MATDDGGPAKDKSLRDEFAGLALCGALQRMSAPLVRATSMDELAAKSYDQADAMLARRKQEPDHV